ncbi:TIGR02452 family protein [Priestia filamentosa]|uniref:TIGR02452 family protein n=1 Tax=Priestia filamentosa TaxID=1402861 RepID=UPI00397E90A8
MNKREELARIAKETLNIVDQGFYKNSLNEKVNIKSEVDKSVAGTILYTPKDTSDILLRLKPEGKYQTKIRVTNETTLSAAKKLKEAEEEKVLALNFASAKNPGGGFLKGSPAQEESLARASSLYESLISKGEMYEYNKKLKTCLYSDYMIYTPDAVIIRNNEGDLENKPYSVSFITSPAVNAGVVRGRESVAAQNQIHPVMKKRIEKILVLGIHHGYKKIVLGAFGCGVFKNRPEDVSSYFKEVILKNPKIRNQYEEIVFAVLDLTDKKQTYQTFKKIMES